jgi:hypothetical protein
MKKYLLSISVLFIIITQCYSQEIDSTISKTRFGDMNCEFVKVKNLDNKNVSYRIFILFNNQKYSQIRDLGVIGIYNENFKTDFINDLLKLKSICGTNQSVTINKEKYRISVMKVGYTMVIGDGEDRSAFIESKEVTQMIAWLKTCKLLL